MEELELIGRVKDGDARAVDELVETYKRPLFAFILRMIDNHETAEDIFQETWIRVIRYIGNFRGDAKFTTWLFQIALNLCRDELRRKSRATLDSIDDHVHHLSQDPDVNPEKMMRAEQVRKVVNDLPDKMREVILLRYYHDMTDSEIACVVGCPEGTVKSRFYRASEILRNKWTHLNRPLG